MNGDDDSAGYACGQENSVGLDDGKRQNKNKTPAALGGVEIAGLNLTREQVKINPVIRSKPFTKVYDLGAHAMVSDSLFNKATRVLMILLRDSAYGGRVFTSPALIASELRDDESNVRKILKRLEDGHHILRVRNDNGGTSILLNPGWYSVGDSDTEQIAKAVWSKEQIKLMKLTKQAATKRP